LGRRGKRAGPGHLKNKIEQALIQSGLKPVGRKFVPHVTLTRLKGVPVAKSKSYLEYHAAFVTAAVTVDHCTLYQSHLGHAAAYEPLADCALA
jgi:2'-5' RNA ligase